MTSEVLMIWPNEQSRRSADGAAMVPRTPSANDDAEDEENVKFD